MIWILSGSFLRTKYNCSLQFLISYPGITVGHFIIINGHVIGRVNFSEFEIKLKLKFLTAYL